MSSFYFPGYGEYKSYLFLSEGEGVKSGSLCPLKHYACCLRRTWATYSLPSNGRSKLFSRRHSLMLTRSHAGTILKNIKTGGDVFWERPRAILLDAEWAERFGHYGVVR